MGAPRPQQEEEGEEVYVKQEEGVEGEGGEEEEEDPMAAMMGFGGFGTTKVSLLIRVRSELTSRTNRPDSTKEQLQMSTPKGHGDNI
jgi:hypothetical protein